MAWTIKGKLGRGEFFFFLCFGTLGTLLTFPSLFFFRDAFLAAWTIKGKLGRGEFFLFFVFGTFGMLLTFPSLLFFRNAFLNLDFGLDYEK